MIYKHKEVGSLELNPHVLEARFAGTVHPSQDEIKFAIANPPKHRHCFVWVKYTEYIQMLIAAKA